MATATKKAEKIQPPKDLDEHNAEKAKSKGKSKPKATKAEAPKDEPKAKPKRDPEALNTRGVYSTERLGLNPPTYRTVNGRWLEVKMDGPDDKGDERWSTKTPWALIDLRKDDAQLVDYFANSDLALRVAVAIDQGKDPELTIRPKDWKRPAKKDKKADA